jgi:FKBP-type peptidyl-prolyl cis-trans isomerase FkpA
LRLLLSLALGTVLLTACSSDDDTPTAAEDVTYAAELGVDLSVMTRHPSGVYMQDLIVGPGAEASLGKRASVHYTGWLPNGTRFDTSEDRDPFVVFPVGNDHRVIEGWNVGILGMRVGGKRLIVIPSYLGYGGSPPPPIPKHSVLVFEVEMISVQ